MAGVENLTEKAGPDLRPLLREDEETSGIRHQQVSRWAKELTDRDAYRKRLCGRAYAAGWSTQKELSPRSNNNADG
jgi:hypothetical protein